jgi:pyruvate/2-oxoglutarate dehydrogenase complex dihydrolipoamide acyltransferase (E2) component
LKQHKEVTLDPILNIPNQGAARWEGDSIDLHLLQGTGPKGRILKEDVLNFIKTGGKSSQPAAPTAPSSPPQSKPESISPKWTINLLTK